ncbi:hypothetical protein MMU07_19500, partial [Aquiflexum sp. LQ15W]|uniref:hypothetical protein n=1 Tax=Cognataquiflexum nitidum TaxID=2922272 RepID=UPI001F12E6A9
NREVKPCSADGTGVTPGRVGRRHIIQTLRFTSEGLFAFRTQRDPTDHRILLNNKETKGTKGGFHYCNDISPPLAAPIRRGG